MKKIQKRSIIIGLGAITLSTLITGCIEKKQAVIEHSCVMYGYGQGSCDFTNTGNATGTECGIIRVYSVHSKEVEETSKFCSGQVEPQSTTKVEFAVPGVDKFCQGLMFSDWRDNCSFEFIPDNSSTDTSVT